MNYGLFFLIYLSMVLYMMYPLVIEHSHGKSSFLVGKPSINGPFSMAMLNNLRPSPMSCTNFNGASAMRWPSLATKRSPEKKEGAATDGIQGVARKRWDTCDIYIYIMVGEWWVNVQISKLSFDSGSVPKKKGGKDSKISHGSSVFPFDGHLRE